MEFTELSKENQKEFSLLLRYKCIGYKTFSPKWISNLALRNKIISIHESSENGFDYYKKMYNLYYQKNEKI